MAGGLKFLIQEDKLYQRYGYLSAAGMGQLISAFEK